MLKIGRVIYIVLAWIFLLCVLAQVFIAGLAIFSDSANWEVHKVFVRIFAMVPLVMFLLTFLSGIRGWVRWISLGLFLLIILQFLTIQVFSSVFVIAALHPVIAVLLFWGAVTTVKKA